MVQLKV